MRAPAELVSTSHSPLTDAGLDAWGWEIAVYLFLGGLTAGVLVLCGQALWRGRRDPERGPSFALGSSGLPAIGLGAISLGMLALLLDLAHKPFVWRLYVTFEPRSPMSWGAWILLLVYPVLITAVLLDPPAWLTARMPRWTRRFRRLVDAPRRIRVIGQVSVATGLALGIYTGILLSSLGARPLWSSALLGPLFLVSGLSTSAAAAHVLSPDRDERDRLLALDNVLIAAELALIGLFLIGLWSGTPAHIAAARLVLGGPYTAVFWVGVVGLGLVVPFVLQALAAARRVAHTPVTAVLVLAGGLTLRFVIVLAGQASHWPRP